MKRMLPVGQAWVKLWVKWFRRLLAREQPGGIGSRASSSTTYASASAGRWNRSLPHLPVRFDTLIEQVLGRLGPTLSAHREI